MNQKLRREGSALVELAIAIPILLLFVVGAVDFGRVYYRSMAVAQAARAGAEYGAQSMTKSADVSAIKSAAKASVASDLTLLDGDLAVARTCECATSTGVFSATIPANTCDGTGCASSNHTVVTIGVTAVKSFATMIRYPAIPNNVTITRATKIRVK